MSIEAIDSILDHILEGCPETPSCQCGNARSHTPKTLDEVVDHLVSGTPASPLRPVLPESARACASSSQPLS